MRPVACATGSVKFSISGYEVRSEPLEPSGTPGCFRRKLALVVMTLPLSKSQLPPAKKRVSTPAGKRDSSQGGSSVASTIHHQNLPPHLS